MIIMSTIVSALQKVEMTPDTAPKGLLARVQEFPEERLPLDERIAIRKAFHLDPAPDYILFRRFNDGRASQVAAYVVDKTYRNCDFDVRELHRHVWLSGVTPLLYVGDVHTVDIYAYPERKNLSGKKKKWESKPIETVSVAETISDELAKRFSSYRLVDGTFWEDSRNKDIAIPEAAAQKVLIDEVKRVDRKLNGKGNTAARRLLLLTLLLKYLEDREVFPCGWFSNFAENAATCIHVFERGGKIGVLSMLRALQKKFNGDVFRLDEDMQNQIDEALLKSLSDFVTVNLDSKTGQYYLWDIYSFKHIPVEVLSHIYQDFADRTEGAVFTPTMLVHLMLDQAMPLDCLRGDETVLDPTCGSGVFLVAAFRRLVQVNVAQNNWMRPTPDDLKAWLARSIFGIELQQEAAAVAAFSLALAICDALQPKVIWEELRFDELLGKNLFVGDYCENIEDVKRKTLGRGFDIVVGNPPFKSELIDGMKGRVKDKKINIPDKQAAYFFLQDCADEALAVGGSICMLQPAGFLYNHQSRHFRELFFSKYKTDGVLDFVSLRGMFSDADTKVIVVISKNIVPAEDHIIHHWTFRRTFSAERKLGFELDYYDYHKVPQAISFKHHWIWKTNLLGGGRLFYVAERLESFKKLADLIDSNNWIAGEGFIEGKKGCKHKAPWITGKPYMPSDALTTNGVDFSKITIMNAKKFQTCYSEERFMPPLVLIRENEELQSAFWGSSRGRITYKDKIIGIHAKQSEEQKLKDFHDNFLRYKGIVRSACYIFSTQLLVGKATAILLSDIRRLPWPEDGNWGLASWEELLLSEVSKYMAKYVRKGQESILLREKPQESHMRQYANLFLGQMGHVIPSIEDAGHGRCDGLMYQAFRLRKGAPLVDWLEEEWASKFRAMIHNSYDDSASFRSVRLLRIFDGETLIFVKPDRLRYWISSIAIRDVDDVLADILMGDQNGVE